MSDKSSRTLSISQAVTPRSLIGISLVFWVVFYLTDVFIDVVFFRKGGFFEQLLEPGWHEVWMRFSILLITVTFAIFAGIFLKRAQTAASHAQTAEQFLNTILDNIPAMVFIKDARELRFARVNAVGERLLGLSTGELIGKNDYDFFPKPQADFFTAKDREVLNTGTVASIPEEEIDTRFQGKRVMYTRKVPILDEAGEPAYLLGISDDITDIKQAEAALQETEFRLRALFDAAAEFIFLIDPEGIIQMVNQCAVRQSGYTEQELTGKNIKKFFTEISPYASECDFSTLKERGHLRVDNDFVCKDGRIIQMECSATAIPNQAGKFTSFLIIQRDVTEERATTRALADSERRFRAIFNSSFQLIGLLDPGGIVLEVNQTALDFSGLSADEVIGRPFWEAVCCSVSPEEQDHIKEMIGQAARGEMVRHEVVVHGKNNTTAVIDFSLKPVPDEHGEVKLIIPEGRDITESKRAQEEMQQHQRELAHMSRLSTLGEMASGIAHELNQPLAAIASYCESAVALMDLQPQLPASLMEIVKRTTEQAHRASTIVRQLRDFSTKRMDNMESLDFDALVQKSIKLLDWELRDTHTRIDLHLPEDGHRILANKVQIEQVIVNLVRNSLEAIREANTSRGHITIQSSILPNDIVELCIADNGAGVAPEMVEHLFDPFQTKKPGGSGLGLSVSRSIIESHGGKLWFDNGHRNGAHFCFTLPLHAG